MKFGLLFIALLGFSNADAQTMKQKALAKEQAPKLQAEYAKQKKACGCSPKFAFDYSKLSDDTSLTFLRVAEHVTTAYEGLCADADAKKTVCAKVKNVAVQIVDPTAPPKFANGTLTVQQKEGSSYGDIKEVLENAL